jgi:hypothetical protein
MNWNKVIQATNINNKILNNSNFSLLLVKTSIKWLRKLKKSYRTMKYKPII